jgi:hypothetical protein
MLRNRVLRPLMIVAVIFLGFVPDEGHALLCARGNGVVVSRSACKRHEHAISLEALLPSPVVRPAFITSRSGPVAVPNPGGDFGTFITPLVVVTTVPAGSYVVTATAFLSNHRPLIDTAHCALTSTSTGTGLAAGAPFANSALVLDGAAASGAMISVVGALTLTFPNPLNDIRLWCTAETPLSMFTAEAMSLVAVPVDRVQAQ